MTALAGGCLCGAVRYAAQSAAEGVVACHCGLCRAWSGHVWAGIEVTDLKIEDEGALRWFQSSDWGERGFCATCGSSLFWRMIEPGMAEVAAGSLDQPTGLHLVRHAWVSAKGDYYQISDGLPQRREL